jgi:hypothetical protein
MLESNPPKTRMMTVIALSTIILLTGLFKRKGKADE